METKKLFQKLSELQTRVTELREWTMSNARELEKMNEEFLEIGCDFLNAVKKDPAGFIMQQDDTTTDIARAQGIPTKKKDSIFTETNYEKGKRHLIDDISMFISFYEIENPENTID